MLEAIQNLKSEIQNLTGGDYVIEEPETNPNKVSGHTTGSAGPATPTGSAGHEARHIMAFSRLMNFTLGATRKSTKETGEHTDDDEDPIRVETHTNRVGAKGEPGGAPLETGWAAPGQTSQTGQYEPLPANADLRKKLVALLGENDGMCRKFLDSVFKYLEINKSVEEVFDDRVNDGGFVVVPNLTVAGERLNGVHKYTEGQKSPYPIGLDAQSLATDDPGKNQRILTYLITIIHESIHREGISGHNSYAKAAYNALTTDEATLNPLPKKKDRERGESMDDARSRYFRSIINTKCKIDPYSVNW